MKRLFFLAIVATASPVFGQIQIERQTRTFDVHVVTIPAADTAKIAVVAENDARQSVAVKQTSPNTFEMLAGQRLYLLISVVDFENGTNALYRRTIADDSPPDDKPPNGNTGDQTALGLRSLSRQLAPQPSAEVANIYRQAAEYMRTGQKVAGLPANDPRAKTDYVVGYWLQATMSPIVARDERWRNWYDNVSAKAYDLNRQQRVTTAEQWAKAFIEIADGLAQHALTLQPHKH